VGALMVVLERVLALGGREARGPELGVHWVEGSEIKLTFFLLVFILILITSQEKKEKLNERKNASLPI